MSRYPDELKESVLRRMLPPENCSVAELSRETGITQATLYTWRTKARKSGAVMPGGGRRQADGWDSANKFAVVLETASLSEAELAEYCRNKGLFVEQVRAWRRACERANARSEEQTAEYARNLKAERKRSRQLEAELRRKEKALAEAAALLVLAKKYRAFPTLEDEDV